MGLLVWRSGSSRQRGIPGPLLALIVLLPVVAGQEQQQHEPLSGGHRVLLGVNRTCYQLCKAGKLPTSAPAAPAAAPSRPSTASASPSSPAPSIKAAPSTAATSTACSTAAAMDPAVLASILQRRQAAKLALGASDFFQIFWSLGNLYTAWADLMKQALAAAQTGDGFQVDANQILQFNMNMASITAYWGSTVSNVLQLSADAVYPIE